jgi:hypothetical protein
MKRHNTSGFTESVSHQCKIKRTRASARGTNRVDPKGEEPPYCEKAPFELLANGEFSERAQASRIRTAYCTGAKQSWKRSPLGGSPLRPFISDSVMPLRVVLSLSDCPKRGVSEHGWAW